MTDPTTYWRERARQTEREVQASRHVIAILLARMGGAATLTTAELTASGGAVTLLEDPVSGSLTLSLTKDH